MARKDNRFEVVHKDSGMFSRRILVDKKTGVNYLYVSEGYSGGLTVMLDRDGKPIVTPMGYAESSF